MMRFILLVGLLLAAAPAWAQGDPACRAEIADVNASFDETLARLNGVSKDDTLEIKCAAIRHHIDVMLKAADVFSRCTTGHGREENMGQALGTAADFEDIASDMGCP
jgi:hypothetical protein